MTTEDNDGTLSTEDSVKFLEEAEKAKKGTILAPDDITEGDLIAIYEFKKEKMPVNLMGMAFKVTAVCRPYIVGTIFADPHKEPVTLDIRFMDFMRVTPEYVKAQETKGTTQEPRKRGGPTEPPPKT